MKSTITLTFSESVENHEKMQIIGNKAKRGYSVELLKNLSEKYGGEYIDLRGWLPIDVQIDETIEKEEAGILIIRNGVEKIFGIKKEEIYEEQKNLEVDKKCFMYGRVVNKHARHNLCFSDFSQEPDYENKKGRVIDFKDDRIKLTNEMRNKMGEMGEEFKKLNAEGNYYYDVEKTFIGAHGDSERRKVIGVRLGEEFPLYYHWYYKNEKIGELCSIEMRGGDVYIMSDKAVGNDWKCRNKYTLRHAAGYLKNIKEFK
jgi:hypothetical protein